MRSTIILAPAILLCLSVCLAAARGCDKNTPSKEQVSVAFEASIVDAVADATHIYFSTWKNPGGSIMKLPLAGGPLEVVVENVPRLDHLGQSGEFLYATKETPGMLKVAKSGGKPEVFAKRLWGSFALDDSRVYAFELAADGHNRLVSYPHDGGDVLVLQDPEHGSAIAVDGEAVYSAPAQVSGNLVRTPKAGGAPTILAHIERSGTPLLLTGDTVYYCSADAMFRVSKAGGTPQQVNEFCAPQLALLNGIFFGVQRSFLGTGMGLAVSSPGRVYIFDGATRRTMLEAPEVAGLLVANGWVYFAARETEAKRMAWYRVRVPN